MWFGANTDYSQKLWGWWVQTHPQLLTLTQQTVCKATTSSAITRGLAQLCPSLCVPKSAGIWSLCRRQGTAQSVPSITPLPAWRYEGCLQQEIQD